MLPGVNSLMKINFLTAVGESSDRYKITRESRTLCKHVYYEKKTKTIEIINIKLNAKAGSQLQNKSIDLL